MGEMHQHSQDTTVAALVLVDVQLPEDRAHMSFDGALADDELPGYRCIRLAFGGQLENLALTRAQVADRIVAAGWRNERLHDCRVERRSATSDPGERVEEVVHAQHPVFQQVAE